MGRKTKNRLPESQANSSANFQPKGDKQAELYNSIMEKEVIISTGPAGAGKTYVALAAALNLLGKKYKKITLVKSVTTIPGENIGYTPGTADEKMAPFVMSYSWNLDKILGKGGYESLFKKGIVEVLPIAFVRGLSIDDSIVIIDETQNIDRHTFKTLISRIGSNSKYIFLGDMDQVDRKNKDSSCLEDIIRIFRMSKVVDIVEFMDSDCVRNPIIPEILQELRIHGI